MHGLLFQFFNVSATTMCGFIRRIIEKTMILFLFSILLDFSLRSIYCFFSTSVSLIFLRFRPQIYGASSEKLLKEFRLFFYFLDVWSMVIWAFFGKFVWRISLVFVELLSLHVQLYVLFFKKL